MAKRAAKRQTGPRTAPTWTSPHEADVNRYCDGVLSGDIVAGRLLIAAIKRHRADLVRATVGGPFVFDPRAAHRVITFIECLKHSTGEFDGLPFLLRPWQKTLLWILFGWLRRADGLRRFREAFITLGRGNGKSPLAAAILLYLLSADLPPEPRAEIKIAATERGKKEDNGGSMIVFNECARFIERSPALSRACRVLTKAIVFLKTDGTITPLGKEAKTKDGFNLHAFVADELHEWGKEHQGVWDKLETAMGKRRQPLALMITTAGSDRSTLWRRKRAEAVKVVRGVYDDPALFCWLCEIDTAEDGGPADDPFGPHADRLVWPKANPNLGVSVKPDYLARMTEKSRHDPDAKTNLLRYHLNVMVRSRQKIINLEAWAACGEDPLPDLARRLCFGGIDLGWRDDLAALYLTFPLEGDRFAVQGWAWTVEQNPHRDLNREPWAGWIRSGRLIVTPGEVFDPRALVAKVKQLRKRYRLQTVALDPNNARALEVELVNDLGVEVYAFAQSGRKYNEPLRTLLDAVSERRLLHGGDPLLTWSAANLVVRHDAAGLMMPDKQDSDDKIDPFVAMLMGFSESLYAGRCATRAGYNERGLRSLKGKS